MVMFGDVAGDKGFQTYLWNSLVKFCTLLLCIEFNKSGKWSHIYTFSKLISTWRKSYSRFQPNNNHTISYFITKRSKDSGSGGGGFEGYLKM